MDLLQNDSSFNETTTTMMIAIMMNSNSNLSSNDCNNQISSSSHHLVSNNSFELNTATSLSDDSGVPHTNSSISSSGSSRIGLCKYEFELAESDGEVSQFDSLDNCSDGGMSAENFNTLKKVPLAPIDPPPEFQDSPQTTLLRSQVLQNYAFKLAKNLIENACTIYTKIPSPSIATNSEPIVNIINPDYDNYDNDHLYNLRNSYNIYDEPPPLAVNNNQSNNTNTSSNHSYSSNSQSNSNPKIKLKKILYSPLHHGSNLSTINNRPNSRNSLNSRLSSSHNSLSVGTSNKVDDSIFITQAMSHDALLGREIIDFYNVPIDSDIYALPVDFINKQSTTQIKQNIKFNYNNNNNFNMKIHRSSNLNNNSNKAKYNKNNFNKKRRKNNNNNIDGCGISNGIIGLNEKYNNNKLKLKTNDKRHSVPENLIEPMHMTLDEVKRYYHSLYSSSSDSTENLNKKQFINNNKKLNHNSVVSGTPISITTITTTSSNTISKISSSNNHSSNNNNKTIKLKSNLNNNNKILINNHNKKLLKDEPLQQQNRQSTSTTTSSTTVKKSSQFSINLNLKQKFCSIFRFRKSSNNHNNNNENHHIDYATTRDGESQQDGDSQHINNHSTTNKKIKFSTRALPPLPANNINNNNLNMNNNNSNSKNNNIITTTTNDVNSTDSPSNAIIDFATNIEKVKECGWYWGPISGEAAEKILSNEPDGSFIVRDSSDDHYIFSLTFKLSGCIRHVRIEQDQGEFSFGSRALFKSRTITEFIENAVEHSRSGRYLFFLHRRPEHGPMRVQLTNPVSRFRHIQSLQHMCRFVILKTVVRKDLIQTLPLPRRILDYLNYKNCYSEQIESDSSQSQFSGDGETS